MRDPITLSTYFQEYANKNETKEKFDIFLHCLFHWLMHLISDLSFYGTTVKLRDFETPQLCIRFTQALLQ